MKKKLKKKEKRLITVFTIKLTKKNKDKKLKLDKK